MTKVAVRDEFGKLLSAIVHDGGNAVDVKMDDYLRLVPPEELEEHPESAPSSSALLVSQHAAFRRLLADEGVSLVSPATQPGAFCQVFARDPCFAIGETV